MIGQLNQPFPRQIVITPQEAHRILTFFFGYGFVKLPVNRLYLEDIEFAQALLVKAIDTTARLGWAVKIYEIVLSDGTGDITKLLKKFGKASFKSWFKHAKGNDLNNPKIARTVRTTIKYELYHSWVFRLQAGDSIWNHLIIFS